MKANDSVILKNYLISSLQFLTEYGYVLKEENVFEGEEIQTLYINNQLKKEIRISLCDSNRTGRFFIIIAVIRIPYLSVDDYVSFDIFLGKKKVEIPASIESLEKSEVRIKKYIDKYVELFRQYAIELISNDLQYPHCFPELT